MVSRPELRNRSAGSPPAEPSLPGGWAPRAVGLLAVPAAAAVVLALVPALPAWAGLTHLVALPPLDVFADLRLLLAWAPSHWTFWGLAVVALAARVALLAALVPVEGRARLWLALSYYAAAWPLALLAAQLSFAAHAGLYSRLFWAAVVVTGAAGLVLAAAPWTGASTLRGALSASFRSGLRVWPLAAYAVALTLVGAAAHGGGPVATASLVPASALLTAATAWWLRRPAGPRARGKALAAIAGMLAVGSLVVVTRGADAVEPASRPGSLLVMSGINSASGQGAIFEMPPNRLGYECAQTYYYSYAGTGHGQPRGDAACPIRTGAPYRPDDTQRPFDEQVRLLAAQAEDLDPPITVAAHSQAAWVAWEAAAREGLPPDTALLLIGPFPDNPVGWPAPGEDGPGRVGGDGFRLLAPLAGRIGFDFAVDAPLSREVLAQPRSGADIFARPLPSGVRALSLTATTDLALMPGGWRIDGAVDACPIREAHPYLPLTPALHRAAEQFFEGSEQPRCPSWREAVPAVSRAWGVPGNGR